MSRVLEKITDERAIYHERLVEIPTPEFIVLYNGIKPFPAEMLLKLSDSYKVEDIAKATGLSIEEVKRMPDSG